MLQTAIIKRSLSGAQSVALAIEPATEKQLTSAVASAAATLTATATVSNKSESSLPPHNVKFNRDQPVRKLSLEDPIVQRLFRPYIPADFQSPGQDKEGRPLPPPLPHSELEWLHKHAYLFGLHPTTDLGLPALNHALHHTEPLDRRVAADLARLESRRRERQQIREEREEKRRLQMFKQGSLSLDDLEDLLERDEIEKSKPPVLPLRLQSKEDREQFVAAKVKTISQLMDDMPRMLEEYRQRRREQRRKIKESKKIF